MVGHVGLLSEVPDNWNGDFSKLTVIHCSSRPKGKSAIKKTTGAYFAKRGVFLRYKLAKAEPQGWLDWLRRLWGSICG